MYKIVITDKSTGEVQYFEVEKFVLGGMVNVTETTADFIVQIGESNVADVRAMLGMIIEGVQTELDREVVEK